MICSNCGNKIEDGSLYCEKCGEDVHIVPDYEPELESSLKETIGNLMDNFIKDEDLDEEMDDLFEYSDITFRFDKIKNTRLFYGFCIFCLLGILTGIVFVGHSIYSKNNYEYQKETGLQYLEDGNYTSAAKYLEKAILYDNSNLELKYTLADVYYRNNKMENAINLLLEIIHESDSTEYRTNDFLLKSYRTLFTIYEQGERYQEIYEVLLQCNNQTILSEYNQYNVSNPVFSVEEGVYKVELPLKITASVPGQIFYTLDGTKPTKFSKEYQGILFLEQGLYTVSAIFINEFGIESEVVKGEYIIQISIPDKPLIYTPSGNYMELTQIEISEIEGIDIFYTIDGTDPNETSTLYIEPITIPLGESEFRFVAINENGAKSEIIACTYTYVESSVHVGQDEVTAGSAVAYLLEKQLLEGKIGSFNGDATAFDGFYSYQSKGVIQIEGKGLFYSFEEMIQYTGSSQQSTGNYYAVDTVTNKCYTLLMLENNVYIINEM